MASEYSDKFSVGHWSVSKWCYLQQQGAMNFQLLGNLIWLVEV